MGLCCQKSPNSQKVYEVSKPIVKKDDDSVSKSVDDQHPKKEPKEEPVPEKEREYPICLEEKDIIELQESRDTWVHVMAFQIDDQEFNFIRDEENDETVSIFYENSYDEDFHIDFVKSTIEELRTEVVTVSYETDGEFNKANADNITAGGQTAKE